MTDSKRHNNPWDIINPEPLDEHALAGLKAQPVHPADRAVEAIGALRSTLKSGEAYSGHLEKLAQRGIEAIRDLEEQLEADRDTLLKIRMCLRGDRVEEALRRAEEWYASNPASREDA